MADPRHDLHEILNVATNAARRAGNILLEGQSGAKSTRQEKGSIVDIVTEVDRDAERCVVDTILKSFPDDGIVAEEGTERKSQTGRRWIIDPLDGTSNFLRNFRMSVVSIGVEVDGKYTVGVVFNPFMNEMFHAVSGAGAFLNGDTLSPPAQQVPYEGAHVSIEGAYMTWARNQRSLIVSGLIENAGAIRAFGSTALDICFVAAGRMDAHVNIGSSVWDIATATVIAHEAGCIVEGLEEGSEPTAHHTIAARPHLVEPLRRLVTEATAKYETGMTPSEDAKAQRSGDVSG